MARKPKTSDAPEKVELGPRNRAAIDEATARNEKRPIRVSIGIECEDDNKMKMICPHGDEDGHIEFLMDTLGTYSSNFVGASMVSLEWMTRQRGVGKANDPVSLNAGLALIGAIEPSDELETALALQMAGCHSLSVEMIAMARQADRTDQIALYGNLAVKLQRTFAAQVEALARLRGGANQTVRVDHVHVHEGGQAVVGNVNQPDGGRGRGRRSAKGQSHATARPCDSPPMLGEDPAGNGVPLASGEGEAALQDARRN